MPMTREKLRGQVLDIMTAKSERSLDSRIGEVLGLFVEHMEIRQPDPSTYCVICEQDFPRVRGSSLMAAKEDPIMVAGTHHYVHKRCGENAGRILNATS
jgi:hypothetical protein